MKVYKNFQGGCKVASFCESSSYLDSQLSKVYCSFKQYLHHFNLYFTSFFKHGPSVLFGSLLNPDLFLISDRSGISGMHDI